LDIGFGRRLAFLTFRLTTLTFRTFSTWVMYSSIRDLPMSRNISTGIYKLPAIYEAEPGEIIFADQHNGPLEDIEADLNNPRPITAGGTGANNAKDARINLGIQELSRIVRLEDFGGSYDNTTDNIPAWNLAVDHADSIDGYILLTGGVGTAYRFSTKPVLDKSVSVIGVNRNVKIRIENSNAEEGLLVKASNVEITGFTISADSANGIVNGSGHCGTCITISDWFVDPSLPEPPLVKNVHIHDMTLTREPGSSNGHAISVLGRSSFINIENIDFIGAGNSAATGYHGNAILTHWGAWTHGVSTHSIGVDAITSSFVDGATITGATSGAKGYIVQQEVVGTAGTFFIKAVIGTFVDNETITIYP